MNERANFTRPSEPDARKPETNPIKRFYAIPTRKNAINAMCAHCVGCTAVEQKDGFPDHLEPGFRTSIRDCTCGSCPLFGFRPYQHTEARDERAADV